MSFVRLRDIARTIQGGRLGLSGKHFVEEGYAAYGAGGLNGRLDVAEFREQAVVLSAIGARCGKCFLTEIEWTSLANTRVIVPDLERVDIRFLWYQLDDESRWPRSGAAQPFIRPSDVDDHTIFLPPLDEQKRIVAKLDQAFATLDRARANVEVNLADVDELLARELGNVFADEDAPETEVRALFDVGSSKRVLKSQWNSSGVPFYRGREITKLSQQGFVENDLFITEEHFEELKRKYGVPVAGDIVITAIGTIGNAHVVLESDRFYFKDASVLWMKKVANVSSEYVLAWLKSPRFFEQLDTGNGATVDTLTIQKLQNMRISVPPIEDQRRVVSKLSSLRVCQPNCVTAIDVMR